MCGKYTSEDNVVTVKKRGVQSLLSASVIRGDKEHERMLKIVDSVVMHPACQKNYANKKLAEISKRKSDGTGSSSPASSSSTPPIVLQVPPSFDFANYCFVCKASCDPSIEGKRTVERRRKISVVTNRQFQIDLLNRLRERDEECEKEIIARIENVDLLASETRYHHICYKRLYYCAKGMTPGRPFSTDVDRAMELIFDYINDNADECQFNLMEIVENIALDFIPDRRTMKKRLKEEYGDEIIMFDAVGFQTIFCFRDTGHKILSQGWYAEKQSDPNEERLRVVREAAAIILQDIRSTPYDTKSYPPSDNFMDNVDDCIPTSLKVILEEIILKSKKGLMESWRRKCTSIAHAIISAARPRSFISSLKIGVGALLYRKFGSKNLIKVLSSLGFCSSYEEISMFEAASIMSPPRRVKSSAFTQFVYDNADFNINTLDGHNTFHCMGGIKCITPYDAIESDEAMNRQCEKTPSAAITEVGNVEILYYGKKKSSGLSNVQVLDIANIRRPPGKSVPTLGDLMWLYGKWACLTGIPGWNGFMEAVTAHKTFAKSKIIFLPFIHAPPSDYDTIYTTLNYALTESKASNSNSCIVTFDQPLFWKARDIVSSANSSSEISSIVVRLGGFHVTLSFLGAIGHIMSGSGLEHALKTIYAENSVEKILSGHAYSRAVRAHFLVHLSLAKRIMETIEFDDYERAEMDNLLRDSDRTVVLGVNENIIVQKVLDKFDAALNECEKNGPTAKLWTQYFKMVTLVKHFIEAERSGNWELHLDTIQKMLPYFHASGHFLYAKSAHLYLQDMSRLREKMPAEEFHKFTDQGYFTIRRTNKFWSGIMSDQTIEQTLNRESKVSGGLFKRGVNDNVAARWTMSSVHMQNICEQIEDFCDIHSGTTEQHVDYRPTRVCRDNFDTEKLDQWFDEHDPFPVDSELMSISTGIIGTESINCHLALECGTIMMNGIVGTNYDAIKFKRKDKVAPLSTVFSSIMIDDTPISINPLLIFQRMSIANKSPEDLEACFAYELSPYPLSLFDEQGMRHGTKSSFYNCFTPLQRSERLGEKRLDVVDGGFLLHKVVWPRVNATFEIICQHYVSYVKRHFEKDVVVVFDGYPEDQETVDLKGWERRRRAAKHRSPNIVVNPISVPSTTQEKFLGNCKNKARFIELLKITLRDADVVVQQAPADADSFIVGTAIYEATNYDEVTIIGEDIDLLVLLTGLGRHLNNIFFKKPSKGRTPEQMFSPASFKFGEFIAQHILFLHAFSGCDTTSSIFNVGKMKFVNTLQKNTYLGAGLSLFIEDDVDKNVLATAGERFLIALFGGGQDVKSLGDLRYKCFAKSVNKNKFNLATLPPTSAATEEHIFRTYLQVQIWLEKNIDATLWGWKQTSRGLEPITTTAEPAPESLLKTISCKCKGNCDNRCGCRKAGLKCSVVCQNCCGETCNNSSEIQELLDDDEDFNIIDNPTDPISNIIVASQDDCDDEMDDVDVAGPSSKRKKNQ